MTTVGLPARKEQLVKSMLLAVSAQTVDAWSFIDETEADVAICDVDSALASVTAARAQQSGRPQCVWLAPAGGHAPDGRRLDDPIGSSSLIAVLDDLSILLAMAAGDAPPAAVAPPAALPAAAAGPNAVAAAPPAPVAAASSATAPLVPASTPAFDLALTLRDLLQRDTVETLQVSRGDIEVRLVPATKHVRVSHAPGDAIFSALLDGSESIRIERLDDPEAIRALPHAPPHIEVLWRLGLAAGGDVLLPPFTAAHNLALSRWPDFGRLTHTAAHVKLAALLVRRPHTVDELAASARVAVGEARRFVNAAALCGLVESRPVAATAPAAVTPPGAAAAARPRGLFRTLRVALGLGGQ